MNTLRVAKPEKGQKIEAMLIQMAQTGQLGGRIGEEELIGLLGKIVLITQLHATGKISLMGSI